MPANYVSFEGRIIADPELRFTSSGIPVAKFRFAVNERFKDAATGEWKDGDALFLNCNAWRDMAENVAEYLEKGKLVLITGKLKQREYEKDGVKRITYEVEADSVGPSLKWKDKSASPGNSPQQSYMAEQPPF